MKSKLIGLVVCATLFGTATHVQASTIIGGNGLLSGSGANQLETWLDNTSLYSGFLQFTNVKASIDGRLIHDHRRLRKFSTSNIFRE
jgi:hypothetical protein